jgi:hypothetical protein
VLLVGLAVDGDGACVGRSSPMIMRMVVDLPAPFGPRNPVTVPGAIVKLRECTAVVSPLARGELACLDHDRDLSGGWDGMGWDRTELSSER